MQETRSLKRFSGVEPLSNGNSHCGCPFCIMGGLGDAIWFFTSGSLVQLNQHLILSRHRNADVGPISWGWWRGRRISLHRSGGRMDVPVQTALWSIMFVAKAIGQAIINTPQWHSSFSVFGLMMNIDTFDNFSQKTLKSKLPRCDFIRAVPLVPMAGAGRKRPSWSFGGWKMSPWWFKMLMVIDALTVNSMFEVLPFNMLGQVGMGTLLRWLPADRATKGAPREGGAWEFAWCILTVLVLVMIYCHHDKSYTLRKNVEYHHQFQTIVIILIIITIMSYVTNGQRPLS